LFVFRALVGALGRCYICVAWSSIHAVCVCVCVCVSVCLSVSFACGVVGARILSYAVGTGGTAGKEAAQRLERPLQEENGVGEQSHTEHHL
jgi:hypothetical protein